MAAINPAISPSIPRDIGTELVNLFTPWEVSQELFDRLEPPAPGAEYQKVQILPTSKEWRFIWRYFHHLKPVHYTVKRVHFIHDRHEQHTFVSTLASIEREATIFPPTWDQESFVVLRAYAIERWKDAAEIFSHITTLEADGRLCKWEHTKVLPLWQWTKPEADCAFPKSSDDGYFGSGIYCTSSARYAADIHSNGHLLLGWVSMREPFPIVSQTDMATLRGKGAYKNYNAHYVSVAPIDRNDTDCMKYYPFPAGEFFTCDEYVVFHKSQVLSQYWVELEVELPYIQVPGDSPKFVNELIHHLMRILQNPQVDRDQKLRDFLNKHLSLLLKLPSNEDLTVEQVNLYEQIIQLVTPQGINKLLRNQMVSAALPQPALPVQNLPAQEEKEPPHAGVEKHRVESQTIARPVAAQPSFDKMNMLLAVQKDGMALCYASEELKGDREIVLAAVQQNRHALHFASEKHKGDREIVLAAVQKDGRALFYASKELKGNRKFVLAAVQKNGLALEHACEQLQDDREIILTAVQQNGQALEHANEQLKGDREIVLAAVQQNGFALNYARKQLRGDREIVLAAVQKYGGALAYASKQLQGDREIVLAAVQQWGIALKDASEELKGDRELVFTAVQQFGIALAQASEELQGDRTIVLAAVQEWGLALQYASEELRGDREIVLAAAAQNRDAVQYATEQLQADEEIRRAASL